MIPRFGIDTSILVRLLTGDPEHEFESCVRALTTIIDDEDGEVSASNQVVGEAYVAVQHHYGVSEEEARAALISVFESGLVSPQNGAAVFTALQAPGGPGLLDRLIADDYGQADLVTLSLDHRMATLAGVRRLTRRGARR